MVNQARIVIGLCGVLATSALGASAAPIPRSSALSRVVNIVRAEGNPVNIGDVKVNGQPVVAGEPVMAKGSWINGMSVTAQNVSSQPIKTLTVCLEFPDLKIRGRSTSVTFCYGDEQDAEANFILGPPLLPGQTVTFRTPATLSALASRRADKVGGKAQDIQRVIIDPESAILDNDLRWHAGYLQRRDPNEPNRWLVIDRNENSGAVSFVRTAYAQGGGCCNIEGSQEVTCCTFNHTPCRRMQDFKSEPCMDRSHRLEHQNELCLVSGGSCNCEYLKAMSCGVDTQ